MYVHNFVELTQRIEMQPFRKDQTEPRVEDLFWTELSVFLRNPKINIIIVLNNRYKTINWYIKLMN